jgi:hypothetical protein
MHSSDSVITLPLSLLSRDYLLRSRFSTFLCTPTSLGRTCQPHPHNSTLHTHLRAQGREICASSSRPRDAQQRQTVFRKASGILSPRSLISCLHRELAHSDEILGNLGKPLQADETTSQLPRFPSEQAFFTCLHLWTRKLGQYFS